MRSFRYRVRVVSSLVYILAASGLIAVACDSRGGSTGGGGCGYDDCGDTTSSSSSTTTTTTTSGGGTCDHTSSECGDSMSGCTACALGGSCADELDVCQSDPECVDFGTCIDACTDQACVDACVMQNPDGAPLYNDLLFCIVCEECPVLCDGVGSGCP